MRQTIKSPERFLEAMQLPYDLDFFAKCHDMQRGTDIDMVTLHHATNKMVLIECKYRDGDHFWIGPRNGQLKTLKLILQNKNIEGYFVIYNSDKTEFYVLSIRDYVPNTSIAYATLPRYSLEQLRAFFAGVESKFDHS